MLVPTKHPKQSFPVRVELFLSVQRVHVLVVFLHPVQEVELILRAWVWENKEFPQKALVGAVLIWLIMLTVHAVLLAAAVNLAWQVANCVAHEVLSVRQAFLSLTQVL